MKQGVLVYDQKSERMDVFVNNRWKPTRIEYGWDERGWYLVGVPTPSLVGLRVRLE